MAKSKPASAPHRHAMPAKGGSSVRQAVPGEFRPTPGPAQPDAPEEEK